MSELEPSGWDSLKAENLPPCKRCGLPIEPRQWITSAGEHHTCVEVAHA
jgi:hypothetical protein